MTSDATISGAKIYPAYGLPATQLIGSFPSHWLIRRAKVLLKEVDVRSETGAEELLSVSHKTGVTPRSEKNVTMFLAESNVGHKICQPGDIVINTMWAWMAAVGVAKQAGLVSPSYAVYRPRERRRLNDTFLDELLRTPNYRDEFRIRSTGITPSRLRLYPDDFLCIPLPIPPAEEQFAIARFVEHCNRQVRQYLAAKQSEMRALAEQREIITRRAFEHPGVPTVRLGQAADRIERPIPRLDDEMYTPIGLYNRGRGIFHKAPTKGKDLGESDFFWLARGDLVLSGQFAWEGAVALASDDDDLCVASHRYHVLRGRNGVVESAYLYSFFQTPLGRMLLNHHSRGAAGRNRPLNIGYLLKEHIPVPPEPEQKEIAALVESEKRFRQQVARLVSAVLDYRIRLISDVVMGRVDVRGVVTQSDDVEESVVLTDGFGLVGDDEEEDAEVDAEAGAAEDLE